MVLDESGTPDHLTAGGASVVQLPIPGSAAAGPEVLLPLEALLVGQVPVRLVSKGVVALTGPVLNNWRLEAEDGLVVSGRA